MSIDKGQNRQLRRIFLRLEAVTQGEQGVGIAMVLAQEVRRIAANPRESGGYAPMLADALRVNGPQPTALAVLADRGVGCDTACGIDGVLSMGENAASESELW